jgi:hypothetical protein
MLVGELGLAFVLAIGIKLAPGQYIWLWLTWS